MTDAADEVQHLCTSWDCDPRGLALGNATAAVPHEPAASHGNIIGPNVGAAELEPLTRFTGWLSDLSAMLLLPIGDIMHVSF